MFGRNERHVGIHKGIDVKCKYRTGKLNYLSAQQIYSAWVYTCYHISQKQLIFHTWYQYSQQRLQQNRQNNLKSKLSSTELRQQKFEHSNDMRKRIMEANKDQNKFLLLSKTFNIWCQFKREIVEPRSRVVLPYSEEKEYIVRYPCLCIR